MKQGIIEKQLRFAINIRNELRGLLRLKSDAMK